ncbi:hypothetical protein [Flavobacterium nackdongense]|uniref:Uncharacterized protein n=1 Tax=Flavobacterium nackdongense TaxID=2547394 RepID=A0A4P6YDM9_9FLAO|nr:hypothetical protein [Flavobacterium nackdongense]QBN18797.1 hypothetical protein E1750_08265 [Flavobacterium nackdongense]
MEQHKLETQFKEKLNSREIKPTEMAWDKLDSLLSAADFSDGEQTIQKPKRKFIWLYVAASILGICFIGNLIINPKETLIENQKNTVVIENQSLNEKEEIENTSPTKQLKHSKTISKQNEKPLVQIAKSKETNIATQIIKTQDEIVVLSQPSNQNETSVANKNSLSTNIDSLLASVEKPNPETNKSSIKINSTALLNQVDGELQVSFREKALNTITKKYKEAKEALANRNNQ